MFSVARKNLQFPQHEAATVFLARQPILDRNLEVFAYELLYRSGDQNSASFQDAAVATSKLIANTFMSIGFDNIAQGKPVFINLPRQFITGEIPLPLPSEGVVLEILEDISADKAALQGVEDLAKRGYTLALDDFVETESNRAFIPHASYIKVDVLPLSDDELISQTQKLKRYKLPLLAEKVETIERFQLCKDLGYEYFQGYFFSKPHIIEGKALGANQSTVLNILTRLQDPECSVEELERVVGSDVGLSYKLLKIINSSYYSLGKTVGSIQQALILLGLNLLKKWVMLISLFSVPGKSSELVVSALLRARHCELLAEKMRLRPDAAFTVGMFSLLDALMDRRLPDLLDNLPFSDEVKAALLHGEGELGGLLRNVIAFQQGRWDQLEARYTQDDSLQRTYEKALIWCGHVKADLAI